MHVLRYKSLVYQRLVDCVYPLNFLSKSIQLILSFNDTLTDIVYRCITN